MELKEVLGWRRSIRFYLPYRPVERAKVEKMLEAARRNDENGRDNLLPDEAFPTEFCGEAFDTFFWEGPATDPLVRSAA